MYLLILLERLKKPYHQLPTAIAIICSKMYIDIARGIGLFYCQKLSGVTSFHIYAIEC